MNTAKSLNCVTSIQFFHFYTLANRTKQLACAALVLGALTFVPSRVWALAAFTDVWYPDGCINYYIADEAEKYAWEISTTMIYFSQHTPLKLNEVTREDDANLRFETATVDLDGGGYTNGYWDENHNDSNKKIRFDSDEAPDRPTVAHEFGHALGFPHEFQRSDRDDYVDITVDTSTVWKWVKSEFDYIYNYSKIGSVYFPDPYYLLSPYDYGSIMNGGYSSSVSGSDELPAWESPAELRDYDGVNNILSVHDINGIYRMYGENLGYNNDGDRFGVAVSSGDYDDDGYDDMVVANLQDGGLWLSFFRSAAKSDVDAIANEPGLTLEHLAWVPWFKVEYDNDVDSDEQITLATGDFNGDGIDDIALGQPGYDGNRGRISILFVNTLPSSSDKDGTYDEDYAPWGHQGIECDVQITAADLGLTGSATVDFRRPRLGASLAAVHATNFRNSSSDGFYHDLVIGAPDARPNLLYSPSDHIGAVIIIKGSVDKSPMNFSVSTTQVVWNPHSGFNDEFGAAVAALPGLNALTGQSDTYYNDYIAVGAPGYSTELGVVYIYGGSTSGTTSTLSAPSRLNSIYGGRSAGRFGHALASFRIRNPQQVRTTYLAIGQPHFTGSDGLKVGQVLLQQIGTSGFQTYVAAFSPSNHSGDDEFGYALAVQQRLYAYFPATQEGGYQTFIGIGMPGAKVDGVRAGKVLIWQPFNENGTVSYSTNTVTPSNPSSITDTRFGESLATVRTLEWEGGFVAGAPEALTQDGHIAGTVSILENTSNASAWDTRKTNVNQESEGDRRPTNL